MADKSEQPAGFTEFQRFRALARRILTTPKAELVKNGTKPKRAKPTAKRKK